MEFLVDLIGSIVPYIKTAILAIIPLGFIIFIHELGHFYAAKRCGIKVNTFSLGFGPRLIGFQWDETEYKISLLPFGGYVQMEGENPSEQTGAPGEFASAPLGSRAFVVAAGPVVNLLFGVLIYWLVFATGLNADSARLVGGLTGLPLGEKGPIQIGLIAEDGAGARGGLMPGDTIVSINGDSVNHWAMFQTRIYTSANRVLELVVERDGKLETLLVKPDAEPSVRGDIGLLSVSSKMETIVGHVKEGSPAAQAGIQAGDQIESINGERLYNVPYFGYLVWHPSANWIDEKYKAFHERINANQEALMLGIRRGDETFTLEMPVHWRVIAAVQKGSIAENAGIRNGDVLVTLNGEEIDKTTLYTRLEAMANAPIEIGLMRDGNLQKVVLAAEKQGPEAKTDGLLFGLAWQVSLSGMEFSEKAAPLPEYNLFTGFGKGVEATWLTFTTVGKTLQQLVGGEVSPKHLAGPIGIAEATSRMFDRVGLSSVLFFIGFISINLCIVNLLPIPIADGGHLLFFAVEKIRGRPMPRKAQEIVQQVCIVLLIALFLYITWFDGVSLIHGLRN
ncbi:MAG: site-2 protease family protein [Candidatus Poribacteria bacterium]|nr:site-2 protease family protein [Candidatus Poribacteria bacterium]